MTPLIDQFPKEGLSRESETSLSALIQSGSEAALNELVISVMRQALLYTARTCRGVIPEDVRVSLCYARLRRAALRFDPEKQRFFPFAKAGLRGAMQTYWKTQGAVRNAGGTVSLDTLVGWNGTGTDDRRAQIFETADYPDREIDDQIEVREHLTGETVEAETDAIQARDEWAEVDKVVGDRLTSRHRTVLSLMYRGGLNGVEIGALLGVSRSRVQVLHAEALKIIRDVIAPDGRRLNRNEHLGA
jgi:RNA polymerase sigma factor (sigma-70 family)